MKKILLIATLVGTCGLLRATTINAPSSLVGTDSLQGDDAYSWGISIAVPTGETITSAEVSFTGITLTASGNSAGTGIIYTDLLDSQNTGVTTKVDNDAPGDYWATQYSGSSITSLGSELFARVGTTLNWNYILSTSELTALNSYLAGGIFNLGIDPDCHYNVGGISFTYTLGSVPPPSTTVPDGAMTAFLLVISLAGLEIFRRQSLLARNKA
jgi:hypothetical protein